MQRYTAPLQKLRQKADRSGALQMLVEIYCNTLTKGDQTYETRLKNPSQPVSF